jgi:PAS domain S-box-containing protein
LSPLELSQAPIDTGDSSRASRVEWEVRARQVAEVFRYAGTATVFSYIGALLTFFVLWDTDDLRRGTIWLGYASVVTCMRFVVIMAYQRRDRAMPVDIWMHCIIGLNLMSGIQWGFLGTLLFPPDPSYRQLFTIMVITCFVGGSITAYSAIPWAHQALSLPAAIPTAVFLFFVQGGVHIFAGIAAIGFCFAIVYYAMNLTRHLEERFRLEIEHEDLLRNVGVTAERLTAENRELAHRAALRGASVESSREEAERLGALFLRSPLPMIECDMAARIIACNPAAERLLGELEEDLRGRALAVHVSPAGHAWPDGAIPDPFKGGKDSVTLEVDVHAHGVRIARSVASFIQVKGHDGRGSGFGVVFAAPPR